MKQVKIQERNCDYQNCFQLWLYAITVTSTDWKQHETEMSSLVAIGIFFHSKKKDFQ